MKRIVCVVFALTLALSLCACAGQTAEPDVTADTAEDAGLAGIANPMAEYSALDEINAAVGTAICLPEGTKAENEQFFVISGTLAEYIFTLDGVEYTLRGAKDDGSDISGLYIGDGTVFENEETLPAYSFGSDFSAFTFISGEYRYTLTAQTTNGTVFQGLGDGILSCIK